MTPRFPFEVILRITVILRYLMHFSPRAAQLTRKVSYSLRQGGAFNSDAWFEFEYQLPQYDPSDVYSGDVDVISSVPSVFKSSTKKAYFYLYGNQPRMVSERPDVPNDQVVRLLLVDPGEDLVQILFDEITYLRTEWSGFYDPWFDVAMEAVRRANNLEEQQAMFETLYAEVIGRAKHLSAEREAGCLSQKQLNHRYDEILRDLWGQYMRFSIPGDLFHPTAVLVNLCVNTGIILEGIKRPEHGLTFLIRERSNPGVITVAVRMANDYMKRANALFAEAVNCVGLDKFYACIYEALHCFMSAGLLHRRLTDYSGDFSGRESDVKLDFEIHIAEEGAAWAHTSLGAALGYFRSADWKDLEDEFVELYVEDRSTDADWLARRNTYSAIPILPRYFVDLIRGRAMITAGSPWIDQGIQVLQGLEIRMEQNPLAVDHFELELLYEGLMAGYRAMRSVADLQRLATKVAVMKLIEYRLGKEPTPG